MRKNRLDEMQVLAPLQSTAATLRCASLHTPQRRKGYLPSAPDRPIRRQTGFAAAEEWDRTWSRQQPGHNTADRTDSWHPAAANCARTPRPYRGIRLSRIVLT